MNSQLFSNLRCRQLPFVIDLDPLIFLLNYVPIHIPHQTEWPLYPRVLICSMPAGEGEAPGGESYNLINPYTLGPDMIAVNTAVMAGASLFVIIRVWVNRRKLQIADCVRGLHAHPVAKLYKGSQKQGEHCEISSRRRSIYFL